MHFCLDIGGTATRGALFAHDGNMLAHATATGAALSLGAEHTADVIREIWQQIRLAIGSNIPPNSKIGIVAGIAGATIPGEAAKLAEILSEFASLRIVSDGYGALIAATQGAPGTLISIGTGLTGMRLFENGECIARSGWGFPIGDQGSGSWLGLSVMQDLTKHIDGIPQAHVISTDFASQIQALTGLTRLDILNWQKNARPKDFASLAPTIVDFAQDGDEYCGFLMQRAAQEIVDLAKALFATSSKNQSNEPNQPSIWLSGGLGAPILPYLEKNSSKLGWCLSKSEPLAGLCLLAMGKTPEENVVPRAARLDK